MRKYFTSLIGKFTSAQPERRRFTGFILLFVAIKMLLNVLAMSHFGFQRDELLYMALGDHLDWGFKEAPPFIALLAKLSSTFFGKSLFATRIFSTVFSGLIVWFTGKLVIELGGKKFAVALACAGLICSPAFAASGYLFEPVVFDQFWWLLLVYFIIRFINTGSGKYLYYLGPVVGIGLMTKFSIIFFIASVITGLLLTKGRSILAKRSVIGASAIALALFIPTLVWEIKHHMPVFTQMQELRFQQLVNISPADFVLQQLIVNGVGLFLSITGLVFLLLSPSLRQYIFLGLSYIFIFLLLMVLHGKNYYMLGAYPMLFAAGACGLEAYTDKKLCSLRTTALVVLTLPNLFLLPLFLPVFSLNQTIALYNAVYYKLPLFEFEARWDDQQLHPLSQNYGVMFGWDEMAEKVAIAYQSLGPEQQKHTLIFAFNYSEASSLHFYGKQYHLPEVISLNSSFSLWAPARMDAEYIIFIDEANGENIKRFSPDMQNCLKLSEIENPLAIEKGTGVFLLAHPQPIFNQRYQVALAQTRLK